MRVCSPLCYFIFRGGANIPDRAGFEKPSMYPLIGNVTFRLLRRVIGREV